MPLIPYMIMMALIIITSFASGQFGMAFCFIMIVAIRLGLRYLKARSHSDHSSDFIQDSPEWNAPEYQEWLKDKKSL